LLSRIEANVQLNHNGLSSETGKVIIINQQPVMECALDILTDLVKHKTVTIRAKGDAIPTAVAVANVITENMLKGNSKVANIEVDSESIDRNYTLISTIKIVIAKTN